LYHDEKFVSNWVFEQSFRTKFSNKVFEQSFRTKFSNKVFEQSFRTKFSNKVFEQAFSKCVAGKRATKGGPFVKWRSQIFRPHCHSTHIN
jgi:hypothetical protein